MKDNKNNCIISFHRYNTRKNRTYLTLNKDLWNILHGSGCFRFDVSKSKNSFAIIRTSKYDPNMIRSTTNRINNKGIMNQLIKAFPKVKPNKAMCTHAMARSKNVKPNRVIFRMNSLYVTRPGSIKLINPKTGKYLKNPKTGDVLKI